MSHWVPFAARVLIGLVLLFAGVSKLRTRTWGMLALEVGTPRAVVLTLPAVESLLGLALILQLGAGMTAWVAVVLFGAFTVTVTQRYLSGSKAPCNCFGDGDAPVSRMTIVRNVALLALAVVATF